MPTARGRLEPIATGNCQAFELSAAQRSAAHGTISQSVSLSKSNLAVGKEAQPDHITRLVEALLGSVPAPSLPQARWSLPAEAPHRREY